MAAANAAFSGAAFAFKAKIRVAVIGTAHGHAASKVRALQQLPVFELAGVCRPPGEPEVAVPGVRRLSADEVVNDASIELVAVETRVEHNLDYAERCVRAGKHVHLDKPPGGSLPRLRALFDDAARHGPTVQMGYQWRYHPAMQLAIEAARKGWLGHVYSMRAVIDKPLGAAERLELAKFPGGILFDEGCHLIDRAIDLFGKPKRATGFLQHSSTIDDGLADNTLAVLEYDRARVEIGMASFQPHGSLYRVLELSGTNGKAVVQPYAPLRLLVDLKEPAGPYKSGAQALEPQEPAGPAYAPDFLEMAQIIRHGARPSYSPEHDLIVHQTLLQVCRQK